MRIEIKGYASTQKYLYEYGEILEYGVERNENKTYTLFKGELDVPPLEVGEKLYIKGIDSIVIIEEKIRSTENEYIYFIEGSSANIDKTIPQELIDKKDKFHEKYSKYEDKYLTDFLENLGGNINIYNSIITLDLIKKYESFGVYINESCYLTSDKKYRLSDVYYKIPRSQSERFYISYGINSLQNSGVLHVYSNNKLDTYCMYLDNLKIKYRVDVHNFCIRIDTHTPEVKKSWWKKFKFSFNINRK